MILSTWYIHPISNPNGPERGKDVEIPVGTLDATPRWDRDLPEDRRRRSAVGAMLRKQGALPKGVKLREFRREGAEWVAIVAITGMHSITLRPTGGES